MMDVVNVILKYRVARQRGLAGEDLEVYDRLVEASHQTDTAEGVRKFKDLIDTDSQKALDAYREYCEKYEETEN